MPVARRVQEAPSSRTEEMLARLLDEWRLQQVGTGEPLIIEEAPASHARTNHIYVVWNEWQPLSPLERSKLILQAYAKYKGQDLANDITIAMGLTPEEARQLRIDFE